MVLLTPLWESLYKSITGQDEIFFNFSQVPLNSALDVTFVVFAYLIGIFGLQFFMKNQKPLYLNGLFIIHNLFLTAISLILLVLMLEQQVPIIFEHGIFWSICNKNAYTEPLRVLYYINMWTKAYELIDTFFLVLKKKPLSFLHVYHHTLTLVLTFSQLKGGNVVQWLVISLNLLVHVFMYYYYARTAMGAKIWWKQLLTVLQITQFIIDLFVCYFCVMTWFASKSRLPSIFDFGYCEGEAISALFGCALLTSYLYLFIEFFQKTYSTRPGDKSKEE